MKCAIVMKIALVVICAAAVLGCQNEGANLTAPESNAQENPQLLTLPGDQSLLKQLSDSKEITVKGGGQLRIQYTEPNPATGKTAFTLDVKLTFETNNVSNDFTASLSVDGKYLMNSLDLQFGPHGTNFLKPAKLSVSVSGMDLSGLKQGAKLYLYYDNNGTWERMSGTVNFNLQKGTISCSNGLLPHFSRYAFGV